MRINFLLYLIFISIPLISQNQGTKSNSKIKLEKKPLSNKKNKNEKSEIGLSGGLFYIAGDIPFQIKNSIGLGFHYRKAISYSFSYRISAFHGQAHGLSTYPWLYSDMGGGLKADIFNVYSQNQEGWFPSYKTYYTYLSVESIFNWGNMNFNKKVTNWNFYLGLGLGFSNYSTWLDLLDGTGDAYTDLKTLTGWNEKDYNTYDGRSKIRNALSSIYDNKYETPGPKQSGKFRLGNETNIDIFLSLCVGFSYKVNNRINLSIENKILLSYNYLLDGIDSRNIYDHIDRIDIPIFSGIGVNFNLGKRSKKNPKYWRNPFISIFTRIDSLEEKSLKNEFVDTDKDGVPDFLDEEPNTMFGCNVNVKGVAIDSDRDGIIDCIDLYPFDPDNNQNKNNDLNYAIDQLRDSLRQASADNISEGKSGLVWLFPVIYFDENKYNLSSKEKVQLNNLINLLKSRPELKLIIEGYTDEKNTEEYNMTLSQKRAQSVYDYLVENGIIKERLKTEFYGESHPAISPCNNESDHTLNRRVEFRVLE
ncbi:MAG: OmpA family protein [Saprospiraceae bacterium]